MKLHGGDIYGLERETGVPALEWLDFSANINPLGLPKDVWISIIPAGLSAACYPDPECGQLREGLAAAHGISKEMILCGNGGADLIYRIAYALRRELAEGADAGGGPDRPWKALVPAPAFLEYEQALKQAGAQVAAPMMGTDFVLRDTILDQITPEMAVMFVCTPNNPTGLLIDPQLLDRLVERTGQTGTRLVVDESFLDFVPDGKTRSLIGRLALHPHVIVLRSFTKLYAMPGIRLGYAVSADLDFLERVERAGQTWSVNALAMAAGLAALKESDYVEASVRYLQKERPWMKAELERLGAQVWDGQANYLFFRLPGCTDLYERLLAHQIIIRRCGNYPGLSEDYYRAAVKSHEQNEKLIRFMQ